MKRWLILYCLVTSFLFFVTGCAFPSEMINVISREDGSGTRDAFTGLFKISQEENGKEIDQTLKEAEITNSTAVVLQTVTEDPNAIGYMSMGSLNNAVKALKINGIAPTQENVKNRTYPVFRPFLILTGNSPGDIEKDFISYCLSKDGQRVIEEEGYISAASELKDYAKTDLSGSIAINGSSSVAPVMEALAEDYMRINPQIKLEIQQTDSTTGISSVSEGIADIGMSSRELKQNELADGLIPQTIAYDGLAVIVNNKNQLDNLNLEDVHDIYTGKIRSWDTLKNGE